MALEDDERVGDERVEAELVGCKGLAPRFLVRRSAIAEGRLKIRYGAGHEHFRLDHFRYRGGTSVPVFIWTDRTKIAE